MYNFDLPPIIKKNLPVSIRKPRVLAWLKNLTFPLTLIHAEFDEFREEIDAQYDWNGLKHSLEWLLNDTYDPIERRIYIIVEDNPSVAYWQEDYEVPDTLWVEDYDMANVFWMEDDEYEAVIPVDYEFSIRIPYSLGVDPYEVFALVETYRFAGLRPRIRWIWDVEAPGIPDTFMPG